MLGAAGEPAVRVMLSRARAELGDTPSPPEDRLWHHTRDLTAGQPGIFLLLPYWCTVMGL